MTSEKVAFGVHLMGWEPKRLERFVAFFCAVARAADIDGIILILVQPSHFLEKHRRIAYAEEWDAEKSRLYGVAHPPPLDLHLIHDTEYTPGVTVSESWNKIQRHAFVEHDAALLVYVDAPVVGRWSAYPSLKDIDQRIGSGVRCALKNDYTLFDYVPVPKPGASDPVENRKAWADKVKIEKRVKRMIAKHLGGKLGLRQWRLFAELRRPRSEFHALSRRLFEELKGQPKVAFDFGIQMIAFGRQKRMEITRVDIGEIPVLEKFDRFKKKLQLARVKFQLIQLKVWLRRLQESQ